MQLNGSHFGNPTVSGISGNFFGKFLNHLPLFPIFGKFWLDEKQSVLNIVCGLGISDRRLDIKHGVGMKLMRATD